NHWAKGNGVISEAIGPNRLRYKGSVTEVIGPLSMKSLALHQNYRCMAGQRIDIMELRTLIVLKNKGLSNRKVASMLKINRKTVDSYISRFKAFELSWEELLQLEEADLRDLFTQDGQTEKDRYEALSAEFSRIQAKMTTP